MGSGGGHHGGSGYTGPSWDEMSPAQKEAYLEQQKQAKIRQAEYEEKEKKRKIRKGIFIGIGIAILIVIIILLVRACAPAFKEGWEQGQKIGEDLFK